ncbi:MAG: insulinase family protein [Dysgonamonadaceae bacterium]|jgi:zinc protease|nr:insulinase family protein [Dysgonamonadaceae bacterium]
MKNQVMKKMACIVGLILCGFSVSLAQPMQDLPIDPKVRYGKLDNGLTYYLRHNELPKSRADFYIAQKVGSILEEDNQRGLAHFLEHMAFNGSKNFPGNQTTNYLETVGVKFGQNLNAYTSFDRTVYNISNVPVTRQGVIDSCLLMLHDWSGALSLEESEIIKERGVVREEMRSRSDGNFRIIEKLFPQIMPGNRYASRLPIGTEEVVMNFTPKELRDYYAKWYRPDLQAIIIVGDIDVDQIESNLKAIFADIPAPVNPAERFYVEVEDNEEPIVGIATDKEATVISASIDFKHEPLPLELRGSIAGFMLDYFDSVLSEIMRERLTELTQQANPPFLFASVRNDWFIYTNTEQSLSGDVYIKGNEIEEGFKTIVREIERVNKYGFTASEYERAKSNLLNRYENLFNEKDKTQNEKYVREYVEHFSNGGYIPGIETEFNLMSTLTPNIPLEAVNQYVQELISDNNIVITLTAPEKDDVVLPSKEDMIRWFKEAKSEDIQPIQETVSNEPLMKELPKGGKITAETKDATFGTTVLTLSNGVKVVIKPTTFKDDEILVGATSPGGSSHFPETDPVNIKLYDYLSNIGGLGNFSKTDLAKVLAGKKASVNPTMGLIYEGMSGSSSVKDFETLLQLIYLNFTAPRLDTDAYQSFIARLKSQLESQEADPDIALVDTIGKELYVNQARNGRLRAGDLDKANYQTIMNWRKDRYADAGDFTFVFTGNIAPEIAKPLIAKYLGSLPTIHRKESFVAISDNYQAGIHRNDFTQKMENLKSTVLDFYWTTIDPTLKNRIEVDMLQQILRIVYTEKVREDEGGSYGVGVSSRIADYPKGQTPLQIYFETEAGKADYLNEIVQREFKNMATAGPRSEDFGKVKEFMLKKQQENEQENSYWSSSIVNFYRTGYDGYTEYVKTLNAVTPADIQKRAQSLLDSKNSIEIIMTGVKEK